MRVFQRDFHRAGQSLQVRVHHLSGDRYRVEVGAEAYEVSASPMPGDAVRLVLGGEAFAAYCASAGRTIQVRVGGRSWNLRQDEAGVAEPEADNGLVEAPMTGTVLKVLVRPGETVRADQDVVLLTAMKMEHSLAAGASGVVAAVEVEEGQTVEQGTILVRVNRL